MSNKRSQTTNLTDKANDKADTTKKAKKIADNANMTHCKLMQSMEISPILFYKKTIILEY